MSKTIAEKLVILSDGLALIDQEKDYQTELILNLQDTIEELATPIPQTAPLISIDNTAGTITATVTQEQGGYVPMGTLNTTITAKHSIDTLIPANIKAGVNILGVTGTMSGGIDTSDATANALMIRANMTAYANGQKITGTAEDVGGKIFDLAGLDGDSDTEIDFYLNTDSQKTYWFAGQSNPGVRVPLETFGTANTANVRSGVTFTSEAGFNATGTMPTVVPAAPTISVNTASGEITSSHTINAGYTAGGTKTNSLQLSVQGGTTITPTTKEQVAVAAGLYTKGDVKVAGDADLTAGNIRNGVNIFGVAGTYTSDATADATMILKDKIAYSKGSKITGTMTNNGAVSPAALSAGGSYTIPAGYHSGSGKVTAKTLAEQTSADAAASNILINKTAWVSGTKVTGTMVNNGAVSPSVLGAGSSYTIPAGYHNGSGKVTAASLAGQTSGTATAALIASGKTAWVNGSQITGTLNKIDEVSISAPSATATGSTYSGGMPIVIMTGKLNPGISGYYQSISGAQTKVTTMTAASNFGDATAADVKAGKTFTSAAGFKVTGTYSGGGNSSNITDLTNTTWLFHYDLDNYWDYGASFPWRLNFTSDNTNYTQINYEDNSDESNDIREIFYNNQWVYTYDTGNHSWWGGDEIRTIHITGGTDVKNANVIAALKEMATLVDSNDLEALGALCDWDIMTNESSHPVITIYNRHPTYYLKCTIYDDTGMPAIYDDGNGTDIDDGNVIVSPDTWATFIIEEQFVNGGSTVYIENMRWTKNV